MPFAAGVWGGFLALFAWAYLTGPTAARLVQRRGAWVLGAGFGLASLVVAVQFGSALTILTSLFMGIGRVRWQRFFDWEQFLKAAWMPLALFLMIGGVPAGLLGVVFGVLAKWGKNGVPKTA